MQKRVTTHELALRFMEISTAKMPHALKQEQFERLAQELLGVKSTFKTVSNPKNLKLPESDPTGEAPFLYKNRPKLPGYKKQKISPKAHFEAIWKPYVDAGILFLDDLRRIDEDCVVGLYLQASRDRKKGIIWNVRDILPTRAIRPARKLKHAGPDENMDLKVA